MPIKKKVRELIDADLRFHPLRPGPDQFQPQPDPEPQGRQVVGDENFWRVQAQNFRDGVLLGQAPVPIQAPEPGAAPVVWNQYVNVFNADPNVFQPVDLNPPENLDPMNDVRPDYPGPKPFPEYLPEHPFDLGMAIAQRDWSDKMTVYQNWLRFRPKPQARFYGDQEKFLTDLREWRLLNGIDLENSTEEKIVRLKKRGEATPRFSLPYSPEEMKLRLKNTIITIDDRPCFVIEAGANVQERGEVKPGVFVQFSTGESSYLLLKNHEIDLRPFEPGYIQRKAFQAETYVRRPARIYRQGLHQENTAFFNVATEAQGRFPGDHIGLRRLLRSLEERNDTVQFSEDLVRDLHKFFNDSGHPPSIRLSNKVALSVRNTAARKVQILFKGIDCGAFDNGFRLDDTFCLPYVRDQLSLVGIK